MTQYPHQDTSVHGDHPEQDREQMLFGRARLALYLVVGFALAMLLGVGITMVMLINEVRDTQLEGTPVGKKLLRSAEQIESCTTPKGACYKRGQRNQAGALKAIRADTRDVVAASLDCQQKGLTEAEAIAKCTDRLLASRAAAEGRKKNPPR